MTGLRSARDNTGVSKTVWVTDDERCMPEQVRCNRRADAVSGVCGKGTSRWPCDQCNQSKRLPSV